MTVDLDTRLLRAFVAVAEELSFTRAAERLFLAQQALSSQIQQLEARVGVKLFERTTRRVELTEAGERLLPHARAALAALDAATKELDALRRQERATLRVGMSGTAMVPLVGETIRRFTEDHPEVVLAVSNTALNQPSAGLKEGAADVAFVRPPFLDEGISMVTVQTEPRYIAVPSDHPLAGRDHVRPEDVVNEPWIWVEGADPRARAFWSLEEFRGGKPLRAGTRITSIEEAFGAVAAGVAITCQGESAVKAIGAGWPQLRFLPLKGVPPAQIAIAWRTSADSELVQAMIRTAIEVGAHNREP
ncbi:LysR family transcriptional regulator [Solirubrobacter soli]|uniref:LysR substrate-binding domain-containing protein n=1 Tax=Solirubrobacter soli TaxID=363832 RepID=UPI000427EB09|nr:LysR family transcriptional regulator [Solirubrobacter soli]